MCDAHADPVSLENANGPSVSPSPGALAQTASPTPSPTPSASPTPGPESPLYQINNDIFTVNRDATLFYYFQGNRDGTAKVKHEIRYGRNLWNDNAQLRIRIPWVTKYPLKGNPYRGFGNLELGYSYNVASKKFDHSLEIRGAFPTNGNNVDNKDWELKAFYNVKWKMPGGSIAYTNEYDQTVIKPPKGTWTSYYEGKVTLPEYAFNTVLRGLKFSAIYNFRVLFDSGGIYKSAIGGTIFGNMNDVALLVIDTWGIGPNGLWKYKFEANATARF